MGGSYYKEGRYMGFKRDFFKFRNKDERENQEKE
jgi:hypothetical protein